MEKEYDIYIVSWGGVGTTAFINYLQEKGFNTNSNYDDDIKKEGWKYSSGVKHLNCPSHEKLKNIKVKKCIFVFDDVINSIYSLWKRGYHHDQCLKLTNKRNNIPMEWTIQDYINNNQDLFEFQQMWDNWIKTKKEYDTLFVKGQQLYKHRYHILKFLDLPINSHWITNHKRNSDWFSSNKKEREGLYNIYGGFNDFILSQPDIQIQKKNTLEIIPLSISDTISSRIKNPNI